MAAWLLFVAIAIAGCGQDNAAKTPAPSIPPPQDNSAAKKQTPPPPPPAAAKSEDAAGKVSRPVTTLDPLPELVAAETVEIKGKTRPGNRMFINGQEAPLGPGGEFAFPFGLQVGKNEIKVVTMGKDKVEDSRTLTIERRPPPPKLTVISPDRSDVENLTISGQTEKGCIVYVDTSLARPDREGNFSAVVQLKEGVNNIKITSTNRDGGTATVQKTVAFTPSTPRLEVIIPEETKSKQVTITGITDTNTVLVLYVNDVRTDINMQNGIFSGSITLEEGANSVTVTAVNKWGKRNTVSHNIFYSTP
jgi:hypothetical protein